MARQSFYVRPAEISWLHSQTWLFVSQTYKKNFGLGVYLPPVFIYVKPGCPMTTRLHSQRQTLIPHLGRGLLVSRATCGKIMSLQKIQIPHFWVFAADEVDLGRVGIWLGARPTMMGGSESKTCKRARTSPRAPPVEVARCRVGLQRRLLRRVIISNTSHAVLRIHRQAISSFLLVLFRADVDGWRCFASPQQLLPPPP